MATILRGYGWESGQNMINTVDKSSTTVRISAIKKTGTYGLEFGNGNDWARFALTGSPLNPSISLWCYLRDAWLSGTSRLRFLLSSGLYIDLLFNLTSKTYDAYINGTLVAAGTIAVPVNDWFHVQYYLVVNNAGSIQVKINGHLSIDYNGDTLPGAETGVPYFYIYTSGVIFNGLSSYDDLVIGYGGFLGDLRCIDIRPSADTAQDDWTPSAGDNYSTVDEISTVAATIDADYNKAGLNGDADELALGDFDGATYVPVAVTAWCRAQQLAANGDSIKIGIDSGGTDDVTEWPLSNTMEYYFHTADQNPADAAEWEDADIDALLVRYEAVIV